MRNRKNRVMVLLAAVASSVFASKDAGAAAITWSGATSSDYATGSNWGGTAPASNTTLSDVRFNINFSSASSFPLVYSEAQGTTIMDVSASGGQTRAMVLGGANSGSTANGIVNITGGTLKLIKDGSNAVLLLGGGADGNYAGTTSMNVTGGLLDASGAEISILGRGNATANATFTISGTGGVIADIMSFGNLASSAGTGTLNINNGGVLTTRVLFDRNGVANSIVNFDGGTIRANDTDNSEEWVRSTNTLTVNILGGGATFDTNGWNNQRITAPLAGVGGITKTGAGSMILENANTYAGPTVISAGKLQIGNGGTTGAIAAGSAVTNDGTLAFNRTDSVTFANTIAGSGGVEINGTGTVTLSGANGYLGPTNVNAGRLNVTGSLTSNVAVANNAAIGGEGSTTGSLVFAGASTLYFDPGTAGALTAGTVDASAGTVKLSLTAPIAGGTGIVVLEAPGGITGTAGAGGNFQFSGRGTVYLNPANTQLLFDYAPATMTWKGGAEPNASGWDVETTQNWDNGGSADKFFNGDRVTFNDSATTFNVAVQAAVQPGSMVFNNKDNAYTLSGSSIAGLGNLVKNEAGSLTITNNNTFSGGSTINAGTVRLGDGAGNTGTLGAGPVVNDAAIVLNYGSSGPALVGDISGTGTISQIGAGTATLTGTNSYSGLTTISAGAMQIGNGGATGSLGTGPVVNDGKLTFNRSGDLTATNAISGSGTVQKLGSGVVTLGGGNTYSGATSIDAGALVVTTSGGALGDNTSGTTVASGATLALSGGIIHPAGEALTISGAGVGANILGAGTATSRGALQSISGSNVWIGDVTVAANDTRIGVQDGASIEVRGNITESVAGVRMVLRGGTAAAGEILLSGSGNYWSGGTDIYGSTIKLGADNALPAIGQVRIGTGSVGVSTLDLNGFNQSVDGLGTVGGAGTDAMITNGGAADSTLTVDTPAADRSFPGIIKDGATNKINLVKTGSYMLTLSGDCAYNGTTTITGGTLRVGSGGTTGALGSGPISNDGALRFSRTTPLAQANAISGSGTLEQAGSSVLTLGGNNSYQGLTTVTTGAILVTAGSAALGDTTAGTVVVGTVNGTTGASVGLSGDITYDAGEALTIQGGGVGANVFGAGTFTQRGALQSVSGNNTWTGPITLAGTGARIGTQTGAQITITGTITGGDGAEMLLRPGSGGVVTIASTGNAWTTTVTYGDGDNTGIVRIGADDALATGAPLLVGPGALDLNGFDQTVGAIGNNSFGTGGAAAASITNLAAADTTSSLTLNTPGDYALDVPIKDGAAGGKVALVMAGAGVQTLVGVSTYSGPTTVNAGTLRVTGAVSNSDIAVNSGGTFEAAASQLVKSLALNEGGSAVVSGADRVLNAGGLTIAGGPDAWTGKLDVRDNDLIIREGDLATILNQVKQGRNEGAWSALAGITSGVAPAGGIYGLAVILNSDDGVTALMPDFAGQPVDENAILVKYSLNGDANLDGVVDGLDYQQIDKGYLLGQPAATYRLGDFDYSGAVNGDDFFLIDMAFLNQSATPPGPVGAAPVPEPGSLMLLGVGAAGMLRRRRR